MESEFRSSLRFLPHLVLALLLLPGLTLAQAGKGRVSKKGSRAEEKERKGEKRREPQSEEGAGKLPKVVVTAFRAPQDPFELSRSIIRVTREELVRGDEASVLDNFNRKIGIWIEKRTATTSDPVLRGLAGANILTLIDGNPLTTFWGEGGVGADDMYGKIEPESVDHIEIIRGPASVLYGSNALGGVILVHTKRPSLAFPSSGWTHSRRVRASYDTNNNGKMTRVDLEAATPDFRVRVGGTWRDLGNGRGGSGVGRLIPSGGKDLNFDMFAEYLLDGPGEMLSFSMQQVTRRDIVRYYRPTQRNENDRTGISLEYSNMTEDGHEGVKARAYYQWKEDRRYFANGDFGVAQWSTWNLESTWQGEGLIDHSDLVAGITFHMDAGQSPGDEQFTIVKPSGSRTKDAPDQDWYNLGVFAEHEWDIVPSLTLTTSLRFDRFLYFARPDAFYNPPGGRPELDRIKDWQHAFTGGVGLVYRPADSWRLAASWSRGFRSFPPHFGITKHDFGILVPTPLRKPIEADNYEVALRYKKPGIESSLVGYYTNFNGFQNVVPGTFQGQTYYDYNNNSVFENDERVFVTSGDGRAILYGVEWEARVEPWRWIGSLPEGCYVSGGFMWNYGRDLTAGDPMEFTHPARGLLTLGYDEPLEGRWYAEVTADFVGAFTRVPGDVLNSSIAYRRDPQNSSSPLIRSDGLPGYSVFDLKAGWKPRENLRVGLNLENLTNKNYRSAHSRMDAFGFTARFYVEMTL